MKKQLLLLLIAFGLCLLFSFRPSKKTVVYGFDKIEKNWGQVNEHLFASKFEVTNLEYTVFLNTISKSLDASTVAQYEVQNENWELEQYDKAYSETYHQHPSFHEFPVVNISHQAARKYCEWLTTAYHLRPNKKYKKVKFRLPTEAEWVEAARAGTQQAPYPWGGYYTRNGKGCLLANYSPIDDSRVRRNRTTGQIEMQPIKGSIHQFRLPTPVTNYFPNNFELYNISGNVAEMLAAEGRTKGGSFASSGYYIRIEAEDEYKGFEEGSPFIGFRYFVDIIEE